MPATLTASPLRALQAFNAVARAGSVAAAAEELAVTPSAISHLVRQLERRLGAVLFTRKGRGLALTPDGERLAAAVGPALATIADALGGFMRRGAELRISTLSSFAVHWLIPRLSRFQAQHADIELLLSTSTRVVDLTTEAFDCAIRLGRGGWPGVTAEELYREELVAACSPQWLSTRRVRAPRDLLRVKLLHSKSRRQDWAQWFKAAGIADFKAGGGPVFETRALAIQAAIAQMGIVVVDPRFIEAELAAGQLTVPFPMRVALDSAYWLVWRPGREVTRPVAAFRRWLAAEVSLSAKRGKRT
ncbi:MAG: LysR substrate-binding domain-containing protein [Gammaproteobacteria bacterium]